MMCADLLELLKKLQVVEETLKETLEERGRGGSGGGSGGGGGKKPNRGNSSC